MRKLDSFLYTNVIRVLFFIVNLVAIYLLLRGHNLPGGGFIGGLVSAISFVLLGIALGVEEIYRITRVDPARIAFTGLTLSVMSALIPVFIGDPFMQQYNTYWTLPLLGKTAVGTPLLLDTGVFLVVVGICTKIIFVLTQSTSRINALVREEEAVYYSILESPIEGDDVDADDQDFLEKKEEKPCK